MYFSGNFNPIICPRTEVTLKVCSWLCLGANEYSNSTTGLNLDLGWSLLIFYPSPRNSLIALATDGFSATISKVLDCI